MCGPGKFCCCCSVAKLWLTFCDTLDCSTSGSSVIHCLPSLLKFMSIESVMLSNHLILCCPLLLLPSIFPNIRVFSNESSLHIMWPKYWSFSFSISPSNEYSGLNPMNSMKRYIFIIFNNKKFYNKCILKTLLVKLISLIQMFSHSCNTTNYLSHLQVKSQKTARVLCLLILVVCSQTIPISPDRSF